MCALFGQGVRVNEVPLSEDPPTTHAAPLAFELASRTGELLTARVRQDVLGTTGAEIRQASWPEVGATVHDYPEEEPIVPRLQRLAPQPLTARRQILGALGLLVRAHEAPPVPRPRVHRDLELARGREVLKRAVLPRFLTPAQAAYWQKRMGEAKRVSPRLVDLVGVFPHVAIAGEAPVHYRAEEAAIAYQLPEKPVPLTTVVIARHHQTGELLLGRFHRV